MKSIKMRGIAAAVTGALLFGFGANAMADSTDDILNALIAKGVLTEEEGVLLQKGRAGEKEAAEKKKETSVSGKVKNGISWESGDKKNSIAIAGRVQLDYRNFNSDNQNKTTEGFDVRRAYFGVSGKLAEYYDYKIVGNFAEKEDTATDKSNQLDEAFFGINWWKQASFRFGQFKMPFSLEEQTSSRFIDFQERSLANKLIPGKEIGAMVHGEPMKGMFYAAALSTGEGRSKVEQNKVHEGNEFIGRVGFNFADMLEHKDNVYHAAVGYTSGEQSGTVAIATNSESKGLGMSVATMAVNSKRTRTGLEGAVALGPVKLQSEWIRASYDHATHGDLDVDSWYASASWLLTGEKYASSYKGGKFDRLSPTKDFDPATFSGGAWEIGARYSDFDAKDFKKVGVIGSTAASQVDSWTLGLKFIPTPNTRLMLNYVDTKFDKAISGEKDEKAITMRAQMDF